MRLTREDFEAAFRRSMDSDGCSYDPYDIAANWEAYCRSPEDFGWLLEHVRPHQRKV